MREVEHSDEKAMGILANFMARSAGGPGELAALLANRDEELSWIRDPKLKSDVVWGLARELMIEGAYNDAAGVIGELVDAGYSQGDAVQWAPRAELIAQYLADRDQHAMALNFFGKAGQGYRITGNADKLKSCLERMSGIHIVLNDLDNAMKSLKWLEQLAGDDKSALSKTRVAMGRIARMQGNAEASKQYFSAAIALWPNGESEDSSYDLGMARVCMGEALLEAGRTEQAERMFKSGLNSLKGKDADLPFMLTAFRGLAQIDAGRGATQQALSWLYQAEGCAAGRVTKQDQFWYCLYDQRGWLLLKNNSLREAVNDFMKVVNSAPPSDALAQSNEGIGIVCIELGNAKQAYTHLGEAARLRTALFPEDHVSLGRVYKNLGMACDLLGKSEEALENYKNAVKYLKSGGSDAKNTLYIEALLCQAHSCSELKKWQEAVDAFNTVIPLLNGDAKSETLKNLAACYDSLGQREKGDECWKLAGYPRVK